MQASGNLQNEDIGTTLIYIKALCLMIFLTELKFFWMIRCST